MNDWYSPDNSIRVIHDDAFHALPTLPVDSIDSIVCDPPAGISFLGRAWDSHSNYGPQTSQGRYLNMLLLGMNSLEDWERGFLVFMCDLATAMLRVAKPGAHALVWAIPRTSDLTGMAMRLAGWEVRDKVAHVFGSGFPKSMDVSKAIDKAAGAEREVVGRRNPYLDGGKRTKYTSGTGVDYGTYTAIEMEDGTIPITAPATEAARQWSGWGTALKPALEDWWLCKKPLIGTVAENVLRYGTGALNIDGTRIGTEQRTYKGSGPHNIKLNNHSTGDTGIGYMDGSGKDLEFTATGRFPANLCWTHHPECKRVGTKKVKGKQITTGQPSKGTESETVEDWICHPDCPSKYFPETTCPGARPTKRGAGTNDGERLEYDEGSAARFFHSTHYSPEEIQSIFYYPKADKAQRAGSKHPTVKSLALMEWLVRLVTPPGGTVLDPCLGSGTTAVAAYRQGFHCIGVEREIEYFQDAVKRCKGETGKYSLFE